jgi:RNA polymerase sigma-70 factor, ECF subfamily
MFSNLSRAARPRTSKRSPGRRFRGEHSQSDAQQLRSLQELFLTSRERFIRIAYRILRNNEDAEDAVQDAFLSACRHLREFEGRSALTTWFTRIVMNAALMLRRKRKNAAAWASHETDATTSGFAETVADIQPNPELAYSRAESYEILKAQLKDLNPLLREAVVMTYYGELSVAEASSALDVPPGTYKARLFRGRRLLQKRAAHVQLRHGTGTTWIPTPTILPN